MGKSLLPVVEGKSEGAGCVWRVALVTAQGKRVTAVKVVEEGEALSLVEMTELERRDHHLGKAQAQTSSQTQHNRGVQTCGMVS